MRRTQIYLDEDLWNALHVRAHSQKTNVSELVCVAARERYLGNPGQRMEAMRAFIGIRKQAGEAQDTALMVRGHRLAQLNSE